MSAAMQPPPGFSELSTQEKIAYVQALWDLIAERPEDVPIPEWHRQIIDQRLAEARAPSTPTRPWAEVRADLAKKLQPIR